MLVAPPLRGVVALAGFVRLWPLGALGGGILLLLILAALLAPLISPYDPTAQYIAGRLEPPGPGHWLGTDQFGRDLFSRIIYGARVSLTVGFLSVLLAGLAGGLVGLLSGYFLGRTDLLVQRLVDVLMSFPLLVLAMLVVAVLGASTTNVVVALAIAYTPLAVRVTRSRAMAVRGAPFVEAAQAIGASEVRILLRHIAPACLAPWLVLVTAELGTAILAESSLSFLGLGTQEPMPSLGGMLGGAALQHMEQAPWMALWPGLAIGLAVFGFNLFGDALRDALDPRLRGPG
jgi:peptide/nickel transport system permease protein